MKLFFPFLFFFLWQNCTSTGKSMLSLERNKFILSAQQDDLASWKTSFSFNSMNAFNQKNVFAISFWKKLFQYLRSLGTFRRSGNCFSEAPVSPAACVSPGFDMALCPLRWDPRCLTSPVWDSSRESWHPQRLVQEQCPNCSGELTLLCAAGYSGCRGDQAVTQVSSGTLRRGYLKLLLLSLETFLPEISALACGKMLLSYANLSISLLFIH